MSSDRRLGVVTKVEPLEIVSGRVRFTGSPGKAALAAGDVVTFAAEGTTAVRVLKKTFKGSIRFDQSCQSAGGRRGIVIETYGPPSPGASIIERVTGANCSRERDDSLEVGDEVEFTMMSDHVALEVRRLRPKGVTAPGEAPPPEGISPADYRGLAAVREAGLLRDLDDARISSLAAALGDDEEPVDGIDIIARHLMSKGAADDALRGPVSVGYARGIAALEGALSERRVDGRDVVDIRGADGRTRSFAARTFADWVAIFDLALAAVGDPRRLVALAHEAEDIEEQIYVLATPAQSAALDRAGWVEDFLELGAPVELP
ncbi:MAG: hypothetical protein KC486_32975 [Myxococcales bacterium]|nr:hypothetical protein [Myxococcales bacterium]